MPVGTVNIPTSGNNAVFYLMGTMNEATSIDANDPMMNFTSTNYPINIIP